MAEQTRTRSSSNGLSSIRDVHDHILPPGWSCKYDSKTRKYYFIRESETETEEEEEEEEEEKEEEEIYVDESIGTNLEKRDKIKATFYQANVDRICKQFPNVEKSYINHLVKMHNNRENLVISALLSESYTRQQFILDESLFYKLKQSFPHIEAEIIRKLLIQNENREHPTISALLNLFGLFNTTRYEHSKKPQLKLKYLKFSFPTIDEIMLLDLLFKNDFDVGCVIKYLNSIGHKSPEIIQIKLSKISETTLLKEASDRLQAPRPKSLLFQTKYHPNLWEQEDIRRTITELYPSIHIFLINWALESTKFDIELTKLFLDTMTPQDSQEYVTRSLPDKIAPLVNVSISRQVQTNSINQDLFGRFLILEIASINSNVEKVNKSTWTKEDGIFQKRIFKLSLGPNKENRKGPNTNNKGFKSHERYGPMIVRKGPDINNKRGSSQKMITRVTKLGPEQNNRKGALGKQMIRLKENKNGENLFENSLTTNFYY